MRLNRLFITLISFLVFIACNNELPVGGDSLPMTSIIKVDTFPLTGLSSSPYKDYSGNLDYHTVGLISDPIAGDINISSVFLPKLIPFSTAIDTISAQANLRLKMIITQTFGDTTLANDWDLYAVNRLWRANEWNYDSTASLDVAPISTINIPAGVDTFYVNLPQSFSQVYHNYYYQFTSNLQSATKTRDSLYKSNVFGFSLVPKSAGSVKMMRASTVSLEIIESDTTYTTTISNFANVYSLENPVDYTSSEYNYLNGYNTNFLKFDVVVTNTDSLKINGFTINSNNLAKVELLFFDDTTLVNSQRVNTFNNIGASQIIVYETSADKLSDDLIKNQPTFAGFKTNGRYSINITNFVNSFILSDITNSNEFYLALRGNDGFYADNLLFNENSSIYYPRIVLTYVETETN